MSNTNTIFGWVLFSGVVGLGLASLSAKVFEADHPTMHENESGEVHWGYVIEAAEGAGAAASGPSLAELLATGDAAAGEAVFAKCLACHTIEQGGSTGIGPNLYGVIGTPIASHAPGFAYSTVLQEHGGEWTYENLDAWFTSPRAFANGTKMSFPGLSSAEERANLILYMRQFGGGPELPAVPVADEAAAAEGAEAEAGAVAEAETDQDAAAEVAEATE